MASKAENIERAYEVWRACGQNETKAARELKKEGFSVTRQTLASWRDEYGWRERASRDTAAEKQLAEGVSEDAMLMELLAQKDKYVSYFATLPVGKIDTQATYAYVSLVNAIRDYKIKMFKHQTVDEVAEVARRQGLSDETIEDIKRKILGIQE